MKTIFQTLQEVFERDYDKYKGWFLTLKVTLTPPPSSSYYKRTF